MICYVSPDPLVAVWLHHCRKLDSTDTACLLLCVCVYIYITFFVRYCAFLEGLPVCNLCSLVLPVVRCFSDSEKHSEKHSTRWPLAPATGRCDLTLKVALLKQAIF